MTAEPEIPFPFDRTLENAIDDERFMLFGDDPPTGHIIVSGEPMAFWLPGDKTPAGIGLNTTEQGG